MTAKTIIRPILNTPGQSEEIGQLGAVQRRAYNAGVDWLNREPGLLKRPKIPSPADVDQEVRAGMTTGEKKRTYGTMPHNRSLNGRLTELVQHAADPEWNRPEWAANLGGAWRGLHLRLVQVDGLELAHKANGLFKKAHAKRARDITRLTEACAKPMPKGRKARRNRTKMQAKLDRLIARPLRRTLRHRTRKGGPWTLELDNNRQLKLADDRRSISVKGLSRPIRLVKPLPEGCQLRSLRLVELRANRHRSRNRRLADVQYEAHISVSMDHTPATAPLPAGPHEVLGIEVGVVRQWATSEAGGYRTVEHRSKQGCCCGRPYAKGNKGRRRHTSGCPISQPRLLRAKARAKPGGQRGTAGAGSNRRRKLEHQAAELGRMRQADRKRQFRQAANALLDSTDIKAVAVEGLKHQHMRAKASGKGAAAKTSLNRSMTEAAPSATLAELKASATARGIRWVAVRPEYTSETCNACGYRPRQRGSTKGRKKQAVFHCPSCGYVPLNADTNAADNTAGLGYGVLAELLDPRATVDEAVKAGIIGNGRRNQPSGGASEDGQPAVYQQGILNLWSGEAHNATPGGASEGQPAPGLAINGAGGGKDGLGTAGTPRPRRSKGPPAGGQSTPVMALGPQLSTYIVSDH